MGVVATDAKVAGGKLTPDGIRKITSLLYLCDDFGLPVVTFADCTGVADCAKCQPDLMTATARLLGELGSIGTAKISVICGKATGLGYIAFASKKYYDYTIAWDKATIGMSPELTRPYLVGAVQAFINKR